MSDKLSDLKEMVNLARLDSFWWPLGDKEGQFKADERLNKARKNLTDYEMRKDSK